MRNGSRVFALVGKPTAEGLIPFESRDVGRTWAVTCEFGCLRLERLTGAEELTDLALFLSTPFTYDYGVGMPNENPELTRAVFGLLPAELELIVTALRQDSFPILGFSNTDLRCAISCNVIPAGWPHVVLSNMALYGNVVCVETFVRIIVSSPSSNHLTSRHPELRAKLKQLMALILMRRGGLPYDLEFLAGTPDMVLASK